jgi:hypothetical protein
MATAAWLGSKGWLLPLSPAVPGLPHALWIDFKQRRSAPAKTVRFPIGLAFGLTVSLLACWGLSSAVGLHWTASDVGLAAKAGVFVAANAGSAIAMATVTQWPSGDAVEMVFEVVGAIFEGLSGL